jgi:NitT/TauT family transport system permease protein
MTSTMWGNRFSLYLLGVLILLVAWQIGSFFYPAVILPSPLETAAALRGLALSGQLFREVGITLGRILIAFGISSLVGVALGIVAGLRPRLHAVLKPAVDLAMSAPPISWLVVILVWFGTGWITPIFTAVVVATPVVFANTYEGIRSVDRDLLAMARIYRGSGKTALEDVYLPSLFPYLFAGLNVAGSLAVRVGVMGELLGSDSGVGNAMALARAYLETPQVFAWVSVTVALLALLEGGLIRPLQRRSEAWRRQP